MSEIEDSKASFEGDLAPVIGRTKYVHLNYIHQGIKLFWTYIGLYRTIKKEQRQQKGFPKASILQNKL